jgi:hypothetical protein
MTMDAEAIVKQSIEKIAAAQAKEASGKLAAFESVMTELSTILSDLVVAMEARPDAAKAIAAELAKLKIQPRIEAAPAAVTVQVNPTPIHNHVAAPAVHVQAAAAAKGWDVTFKFDGINQTIPTGATFKRIN